MGKRRFLRPKTPSGKGVTVKHVSLVVGSAILCAIGILESAGYIKIQFVDRWSVSRVILSSSSTLAKNMTTNHTRGTNHTSSMTAAASRIAPSSQLSKAQEREETRTPEAPAPEPVAPLPSTPEPTLPAPATPKPAPTTTTTTTTTETVTTPVTTDNTHDNNNYWTPPLADFAYCDEHNWIPMKDEAPQFERTVHNTKPHFSIRRQDFAPHHSTKCQTTQQIKNAIRYGQRIFDDNPHMTSFEKRTAGANFTYSTFVHDQCDLPILQPHQLCLALNRYSKIVFQGDSLTRHAHYGLLIALSNDFIRGSYPGACICDGQFTNHPNCITKIHMKANMAPSQRHLCSQLPADDPTGQVEIAYNINRLHRGVYVLNQMQDTERVINCALPEQKPVLLILQGGVHTSYNAQATFDSLIQPFFRDAVVQECLRRRKLYMIFCLSSQQSPQVDDEYPHQNRNHTVVFDETMVYLARHKYYLENLHFVHWANFTDGVIWSDGFHMATGGNYFKAQHLVNLANAILDEQLYLKHPEFTPLPA